MRHVVALSDADWEAWLKKSPSLKNPVVLMETEYLSASGLVQFYASDKGYIDKFNVSAPNYLPRIKSKVVVNEDTTGIRINNLDIYLKEHIDAKRFQSYETRIYFGDKSWPRADFRVQGTFINSKVLMTDVKIIQFNFNEAGDEFLDQQVKLPGLPYMFGETLNFAPIYQSSLEYYFYANSAKSVGYIADKGVELALTAYASSFLSNKQTITLDVAPVGIVTGRFSGGSTISGLLTEISGMCDVAIPFNSVQVATYDTFTLGWAVNDEPSAREIINTFVSSFGGNSRFNRNLELEIFVFAEPGVSSRTITDGRIKGVLKQTAQDEVVNRVEIGFDKIWRVMGQDDWAGAATLDREVFQKPWRVITNTAPALKTNKTFRVNTALQDNTHALDEAVRRLDLKQTPRGRYALEMDSWGIVNDIGETITVTSKRHQLTSSGMDFVVIGNEKHLTDGYCKLTLWA